MERRMEWRESERVRENAVSPPRARQEDVVSELLRAVMEIGDPSQPGLPGPPRSTSPHDPVSGPRSPPGAAAPRPTGAGPGHSFHAGPPPAGASPHLAAGPPPSVSPDAAAAAAAAAEGDGAGPLGRQIAAAKPSGSGRVAPKEGEVFAWEVKHGRYFAGSARQVSESAAAAAAAAAAVEEGTGGKVAAAGGDEELPPAVLAPASKLPQPRGLSRALGSALSVRVSGRLILWFGAGVACVFVVIVLLFATHAI
jgi:hypothetical protein